MQQGSGLTRGCTPAKRFANLLRPYLVAYNATLHRLIACSGWAASRKAATILSYMTEADEHASPTATVPAATRWRFRLPRIDWRAKARWFAAEYLIIVLGVLSAVAVNAWWQGVQDRTAEQALLRGLRADFAYNRADYARVDSGHIRTIESARRMLAMTGPEAPARDPAVFDSVLFQILGWSNFEPSLGRVNALLSSGQIVLIRNDSLQAPSLPGRPISRSSARSRRTRGCSFTTGSTRTSGTAIPTQRWTRLPASSTSLRAPFLQAAKHWYAISRSRTTSRSGG